MTCIVGIEHDGKVTIGGDSAGVSGSSLTIRADEKVFVSGPFAFGFTTSFRMGQLLCYAFVPPSLRSDADPDAFMATTFVDAVRASLKDGGCASLKDGVESGGDFLVGCAGRLYAVHSDYQVARSLVGYAAIGCGSDLALGALHAARGLNPMLTAHRQITIALDAAATWSTGVVPPFNIVTA